MRHVNMTTTYIITHGVLTEDLQTRSVLDMRTWVLLVLLAYFVALDVACITNRDCSVCHYCDAKSRRCVQVEFNTDPFDDCGVKCDVKLVCGSEPYCVYPQTPKCTCEYGSGTCLDQTHPPLVGLSLDSQPPVTFQPALSLSEDEIATIKRLISASIVETRPLPPYEDRFDWTQFIEVYELDIHVVLLLLIVIGFSGLLLFSCHLRRKLAAHEQEIERSKGQ